MRRTLFTTLGGLLLIFPATMAADAGRAIPQDPKRQEQRYRDMLAWNQRTLVGAYDKVGKKDARWDKPAREALGLAARFFSHAIDPHTRLDEVYSPAKRALDAGCDDPLILYLYARSSYYPNYPGAEELERRYTAAALAMERSAYPVFRRIIALKKAGLEKAALKNLSADDRKEAARLLNAALALLPKSVVADERNPDMENNWFELPRDVINGHRQLTGDFQAAFERVDAELAKTPSLKVIRLQVRADFLIAHAWEARGSGFANTVTAEGWQKFGERLKEARKTLEDAWAAQPGNGHTAAEMLTVHKGLGGPRAEMEQWFERAMKADGNNRSACWAKMDWLDPKWHGSAEEVLAFGRACRDTKNWRAGITLLLADAHRRVAQQMADDERRKYMHSEAVWKDIQAVYEEYLQHCPNDFTNRSFYAAHCFMCGKYAESDKQFKIVGERLYWSSSFPEKWMKEIREYVAKAAKSPPGKPPATQPPTQRPVLPKPPE